MMFRIAAFWLTLPCAALAQDVLIVGEVHDNPAHHLTQAEQVQSLNPAAVVYEMLTPAQADGAVLADAGSMTALKSYLDWDHSGWPDFAMYYPIFSASPDARVYGAGVPREMAFAALERGLAATFGSDAADFGLDSPLTEVQQHAREALQMAAHCDALPAEMLPGMVDIQRLRDASLARATLRAFADTGGPVAVITGNGHARRDWGVPAYLDRVAPDLKIHVIGQAEDDRSLAGGFDEMLSSPGVERPDPCAAFQ